MISRIWNCTPMMLLVALLTIGATTVSYLTLDGNKNCSQEVQFSNAANYFYGDGSNLTNVPAGSASMATLTDATITSAAQGDILYYSSAGRWENLPAGDSGKFLKTQGAAADPVWDTAAASNTWSVINASTTALVNQGHFLYVAPGGAELDLTTPAAATIGQSIQICILYNGAATSMWLYSDDPIEGSSDDLELDTAPPNAVWTFTYSNSEYGWVRTN